MGENNPFSFIGGAAPTTATALSAPHASADVPGASTAPGASQTAALASVAGAGSAPGAGVGAPTDTGGVGSDLTPNTGTPVGVALSHGMDYLTEHPVTAGFDLLSLALGMATGGLPGLGLAGLKSVISNTVMAAPSQAATDLLSGLFAGPQDFGTPAGPALAAGSSAAPGANDLSQGQGGIGGGGALGGGAAAGASAPGQGAGQGASPATI